MPKSKKSQIVFTSKSKTKGKSGKEKLLVEIEAALLKYKHVYVLVIENFRNKFVQELRLHFKGTSRFFGGKNKLMQMALEKDKRPNIDKLIPYLHGDGRYLFFTNEQPLTVEQYFKNWSPLDFANAGFLATRDVVIPQGTLEQPASLELQFRNLGVPTTLKNGAIEVLGEYTVCRAGKPLSTESAKLLRLLGEKMNETKIDILAKWDPSGEFQSFVGDVEEEACDEE